MDCGGPDCPPCPEHYTCEVDADCQMDVCKEGICDATEDDHCENGVKDGDETDIDCGGSCPGCPMGYGCEEHDDCASEGIIFINCNENICGGIATCEDYSQNGHETDVDCGGPYCYPCGDGASCQSDEDCASGTCDQGACTAPDYTCDNDVKDGYETDVDCGGPVCGPCPDGHACTFSSDCETWCDQGACGDTCNDGVQNVYETDVDCGGGVCSPCDIGKGCEEDDDCFSEVCADGICDLAPTCGDGDQNDEETDVDCGGPACVPCDAGDSCLVNSDCATGKCSEDQECIYTVRYLQSSDASTTCDAPGAAVTIFTDVTLSPLGVVTVAFSLGETTEGY
ncbi:MAG: hypothetical protein ACOC0J_02250, partial [Myxococcota bacterium]